MPHLVVNTRLLLPGRLEGISRFAYEVLHRLVTRHPEVRYTFLFDRPYDPAHLPAGPVTARVVFPPARHPLLWHAWFHGRVTHLLERLQPDLFFSPEFYLSLHPRIPQVPVFHDLAYEHYPEDLPAWASRYCRTWSPRYARRAAHLLTVSDFSRQDLVERYGLDPGRISVVYNGASGAFAPLDPVAQQAVRDRYTGGQPYYHFVGTLQPRKNIVHLLRAFDAFRAQARRPVRLLLAGRPGWQYQEALRTYEAMRYREEVHFTGFVPDTELAAIYGASEGLVYVPFLEGFGIPILEAFHSDIPVICSDRSAMPEVAGDAALCVDPTDVEAITAAWLRLHHEPGLREALVARGRVQRERFSWDQTYARVWEVLSRWLG